MKHPDSIQTDVDEGLIRGVPLHVCLSNWGRREVYLKEKRSFEGLIGLTYVVGQPFRCLGGTSVPPGMRTIMSSAAPPSTSSIF